VARGTPKPSWTTVPNTIAAVAAAKRAKMREKYLAIPNKATGDQKILGFQYGKLVRWKDQRRVMPRRASGNWVFG
jgi:hypothetical protein